MSSPGGMVRVCGRVVAEAYHKAPPGTTQHVVDLCPGELAPGCREDPLICGHQGNQRGVRCIWYNNHSFIYHKFTDLNHKQQQVTLCKKPLVIFNMMIIPKLR